MDVHQDFIEVVGIGVKGSESLFRNRVKNDHKALREYLGGLSRGVELRCCYEASSCGYVVYRWLREWGIECQVIAPSLMPRLPGDRQKTDGRDAYKLAIWNRGEQLTSVRVPDLVEEGVRTLVRCREAASQDVVRARHRLLKFLQGQGLIYRAGRNWTKRHWQYLRGIQFEGSLRVVFDEYMSRLEYHLYRLQELDRKVEAIAQSQAFKSSVGVLCCLRGIGVLTAMVLLTEIIDFRRFGRAGQLMSYVGLVSSQHSSGNVVRMGPITKTGNRRCRAALIESAWHYRHKPALGVRLKNALRNQSAEMGLISWKAQQRLYKKYWNVANRKGNQKAVVAVARELTGFVWAIMQQA
jgi:transposase